jgi:RNA polymerase sigma-70 factor (ECF subfamily)
VQTLSTPRNTLGTNNYAINTLPGQYAKQIDQFRIEDILVRCRRGERSAVETLLKRFERPIYALAYRLAGNYDDANDVAATAALRICQTIHTCKSAITLPAWVNRVVSNVFYDMYRRSQKCPAVSLDTLTERTNVSSLHANDSKQKSPLAYVHENEQKQILASAISILPSFQRQIVTMFYQDEMTYEEIADIMKIPVGTVKSRLSRARLALLKNLQGQQSAFLN